QMQDRAIDGVLELFLFLVVVRDAGAFFDGTFAVHGLGLEQERVGQRCLARHFMPDEGHRANIVHLELGHDHSRVLLTVAMTCRRSSFPSYSARPTMQPATPVLARRWTSSALLTPPDAITGIDTAAAISFMASRFGPCIMPSRLMSVYTMPA